jgi:chromosome segregation ATPase
MRKTACFALMGFLCTVPCSGQSSPADSETLKAILTEIRGLHNDVRLSQTTQILLTELEVQQTAVNKAQSRCDDARNTLTQIRSQQKNLTVQLARFEEDAAPMMDGDQKKRLTDMQANFKSSLVALKSQEQDRSNELMDAESALKKQQDTLSGIQDQLNEVVKKLQPARNP